MSGFTIYLDDSGTSPSQHVAIATALIIPTARISHLKSEWGALKEKFGFTEFHTSVFVARNYKSEFAKWSDEKQDRLFNRVTQVAKKYGVRAFSFAVYKKEYDELAPEQFRASLGRQHYTWAVRNVVQRVDNFSRLRKMPCTWIFQWMGNPGDPKRLEVEDVMDQAQLLANEQGIGGDYTDYGFGMSGDFPGLQCVDAIGWTCYHKALEIYRSKPPHRFAEQGWKAFEGHRGETGWLLAFLVRRENLMRGFKSSMQNEGLMDFYKRWEAQRKKSKSRKEPNQLG